MGQVDSVYASAIFELAKEKNSLDEFNEEINGVYEVFNDEEKFMEVLSTPVINSDEKKEILEKVFADKISRDMLNFLKLLVDKNRIHNLHGICESFFEMYRKEVGIVLAEVYTVEEFSDELEKNLAEKLSELTGKKVEIKQIVDDALLGGVKIKIGSKIIDNSVLHQLNKLGESLREVSL